MISSLRGFRDIYGEDWDKFEEIVEGFKEVLSRFNVVWIETPIVEPLELFVRSVGEMTDIVQKQMFAFKDRGSREVALRPEGTAGVVRAFLENRLNSPIRLAYFGPMFRAERPQKGRYRQFYQLGVEFIGYSGVYSDADMILSAYECVRSLGIDAVVYANALGGNQTKRVFSEVLKDILMDADLCEDCKLRRERNPLRVMDCKICSPKLNFPDIMEYAPSHKVEDFQKTVEVLKDLGVPIERDPKLVRGLDYYTDIVFEIKSPKLEASQNTILAGGRYDDLIMDIGGENIPACGWAAGIDRILLIYEGKERKREIYFVVRTSDEYLSRSYEILNHLRRNGKVADMVFEVGKSLKSQMRRANKLGSKWVIFVGEEEVKTGKYKIKDLETGEESILIIPGL